ncbi:MAG TPA: hypothetical protein VN376_09330, partial [Longilinea sp.]|nr:hypothetical protein [Longilinea sp.]
MKKLRLISILLVLILLSINFSPASAQDYSFRIPSETVTLFLNADATVTLDYVYVFQNESYAPSIEYVDIGLPSNIDYNSSNITVEVNGNSVYSVSPVTNGFSVYLGGYSIGPGQTGTVHIRIPNINGMVYATTIDNLDYASLRYSPNWFGSQYVNGTTQISVTFVLPAGMDSAEPRYYTPSNNWPGNSEPTSSYDSQNRVYYQWYAAQGDGSQQYEFGTAIPASYLPAASLKTAPLVNLSIDWEAIMPCLCFGGFGAFFVVIMIWGSISAKKRRLQYLPPKISIEGHGIKRGLTAVEAAILMEKPLDKILSMVLFSTIKKNALEVVTKEPLKVNVTDPLPEGLYPYEITFLTAMKEARPVDQRKGMQSMMVDLVKVVQDKMKGFSRKETIAFYEDIIQRAWAQVESAQTPEMKGQAWDQVMDWTIMDNNYDRRTHDTFSHGPVFLPMWWGRYDPGYRGASMAGAGSSNVPSLGPQRTSGSLNLPTLPGADFANTMVNGVTKFSNQVVGDINSFTGNITNSTNPLPKTSSYSSGRSGGGGHSCACACACAGCACACAGGGR